MPYVNGVWEPEDDSVSKRLNGLLSQNSDYIERARTAGLATANQRGLLNSSFAAGAAEGAAIDRGLPIASQDAQQTYGKNFSRQQSDQALKQQREQLDTQERINTANLNQQREISFAQIASQEREKAAGLLATNNQSYNTAFSAIATFKDIPADVRDKYFENLSARATANNKVAEQLYGYTFDWGGVKPLTTAKAATPAKAVAAAPVKVAERNSTALGDGGR